MPIHKFNLNDMFSKQFGYKPMDIDIKEKEVLKKSTPGKYGSYYATDAMGRTVFMPLTLGGLFLPYTWVNVSGSKNIVETPMTERRGVVREHISMDDYQFNVKGFVIGHDGRYPEKDVEDLRILFERNEALSCKSILTDIFLLSTEHGGQDKVVIQNFHLHENPGVEHVRAFEFQMVSDQAFELEII
ncbi:MAG: hypothetical protein H0X62_04815 [Bacteroidetes bacterium]|nr:hypothetical protein [Bacteroidota bacterium]